MKEEIREIKEVIRDMLEDSVIDTLIEAQERLNIESGDISPLDEIKLNFMIDDLTRFIITILIKQKGE